MTNFILIARFSKLVMKLTVSFSQRTLKYFRVQWTFFKWARLHLVGPTSVTRIKSSMSVTPSSPSLLHYPKY